MTFAATVKATRRSIGDVTVPLTVQVVKTYQAFLSLEKEWTRLLESSRSNLVFLTHEWFRCWWEAFGGKDQLFVLCVRQNGRLVGLAPLYLRRTWFRRLPVRKLSLMANTYSESAGFILGPPERSVLYAIFGYLADQSHVWDMLDLTRIRDDDEACQYLAEAAGRFDFNCTVRPDIRVPYITVEGDWKSFLSQRTRNFRKTVNRRLNTIAKQSDPVRIVKLRTPDQIAAAIPEIMAISSRSWKAGANRAMSDEPGAKVFFDKLSALLGGRGWIDLWMLYSADRPVAFEYHLNYAGVTAPIRADFDESYQRLSPGAHLEYVIIRGLFDDPSRAIREYNTCADHYAYELRWTEHVRSHVRLWMFPSSWYGRAMYLLGRLRRPRRKKEVALQVQTTSVISRMLQC